MRRCFWVAWAALGLPPWRQVGLDAWIISGRRRKVRLEEVPVAQRAPIIREYLRLAPGGRPHIGLGNMATLEECERVGPGHPVFRVAEAEALD